MCGRFAFKTTEDLLEDLLGITHFTVSIEPNYNIAPTNEAYAAIRVKDDIRLGKLSWGLIPGWAQDKKSQGNMINARTESIFEKPPFKKSILMNRCLIPASGFYEWYHDKSQKNPVYIYPNKSQIFVFAGIWSKWVNPQDQAETLFTFSILTTEANRKIQDIHPRMPVILEGENIQRYLAQNTDEKSLKELFKPLSVDNLELHDVSPEVNSVKNNLAQNILKWEKNELF